MSNRTIRNITTILMIFTTILFAGCTNSKRSADTVSPGTAIGIVDVVKLIKAHPKYNELEVLQRQAATLSAQLELATQTTSLGALQAEIAGQLDVALQQEFQAKIQDKKAEIDAALAAKAEKLKVSMDAEMKAYADELDKTYQPQIFSLQLKSKTVQLSKEELATLQKELEDLQSKRASQITVKEQQISEQFVSLMKQEQQAAERQLDSYSAQLGADLAQRGQQKMAEIASRNQATNSTVSGSNDNASLLAKQQQAAALEQTIIQDIKDKTGKVATERQLEAVLTRIVVNINAIDLTDAVIAEIKK